MFWFIVLLLLAGAGFYFYQKLTRIESEIRAEQDAEIAKAAAANAQQKPAPQKPKEPAKPEPAAVLAKATKAEPAAPKPTVVEKSPVTEENLALEKQIVAAVVKQPGVQQTELYGTFAELNKKQLQTLLKEMADKGALKREKKGSSYLLFPA